MAKSKPYPGIDLGRAYQYLLRLRNTNLNRKFRSNELMHAIGYANRGGRASRALGALRQFGFVDFDDTFYTVTKFGKKLLSTDANDPAYKGYVLQAAKKPELYKLLYLKTNEQREVALTDTLVGIMTNYGIDRNDMKSVLKNYNETLKFIDHGITFELPSPMKLRKASSEASTIKDVVSINFGDNLTIEVPRDFILEAALYDLAKNGPSSKIKLISDRHNVDVVERVI